jgi:suppressor of ftsI
MLRIISGLVIYLSVTSSIYASDCLKTNTVDDPPQFQWTHHPVTGSNPEEYYSGTMEIGEASFVIGGDTITTRAYKQAGTAYTIPGPTISMTRGNKYILRFNNTLPYEAPSAEHNVLKDPNISNIHTHGLHISGESPSDDVTRSFEGGRGGDFVYDIPADHMGGTYWYHAHHHGSTFLQVSAGAFGLLIIDDSVDDNLPTGVENMDERQLILAYLDPAVAGSGGDTLIKGTLSPTWTTNGTITGNMCMPQNTWQRFRVLLADREARPKTVTIEGQCQVAVMARDGVWRTSGPRILTDGSLELTGASRADLAVNCLDDAVIKVNNTTVAAIQVDSTLPTDDAAHPYSDAYPADPPSLIWSATRPVYLQDLRTATDVSAENVDIGNRGINGSKYNIDVPTFTLPASDIQEWDIKGASRHPFHLHVYHMQVQGNCGDYEDGEYYDVIAGNCKIRFNLDPGTSSVFDGRTIMHCHILEHEDMGVMGWADVVGGEVAPFYPDDDNFTYSEHYVIDGGTPPTNPPAAPSGLVATAVSSDQISLNWIDNSIDEDNFNVESSSDGITFGIPVSLSENTISFIDSGLDTSTTFYYRVSASNAKGSSDFSGIASATTTDGGTATAVVVDTIVVTTASKGKRQKRGQAMIRVIDDLGNPVEGAVISGTFSGTFSETIDSSAATDTNGTTTVQTSDAAKGIVEVTFCVSSIVHPSLTDYTGEGVCSSL